MDHWSAHFALLRRVRALSKGDSAPGSGGSAARLEAPRRARQRETPPGPLPADATGDWSASRLLPSSLQLPPTFELPPVRADAGPHARLRLAVQPSSKCQEIPAQAD